MKKKILLYSVFLVLIFLIGYAIFHSFTNDKFNYYSAKEETINYLNKNETKLTKLVNEIYESKLSKKNPLEGIDLAAYKYSKDFNFINESEYVQLDINSQGMLGGQYYGLIYSKKSERDIIIYDENKETKNGNNYFIRQKISNNWYFYYDDYDGSVNIDKIAR